MVANFEAIIWATERFAVNFAVMLAGSNAAVRVIIVAFDLASIIAKVTADITTGMAAPGVGVRLSASSLRELE